jgi:hypothetical protein
MLVGTEMPACVAIPVRPTDEGETVGRLSVAVRTPGVVIAGENVTLSWQFCPAGIVHEDDVEKSLAFGPVMVTLPTCAGAVPELATVTACDGLDAPSLCAANVRAAGEACSDAAAVAVPDRATCWFPGEALSAKTRAADSAPGP